MAGDGSTGTDIAPDSGSRAWIARLGDTRMDASASVLPDPPSGNPDGQLVHTVAYKVAPADRTMAPDGGMVVAGGAFYDSGRSRALLWTCAESSIDAARTGPGTVPGATRFLDGSRPDGHPYLP